MPNTTQPPIIDLTDIVEQKASASPPYRTEKDELSGHVSDLMKEDKSADSPEEDIGLDDLLAQLNDGEGEGAPSTPNVNPNERLDMPGMGDMDAMIGQFGSSAADSGPDADAAGQTTEADRELDELLSDLDEPATRSAAQPADAPGDAELDDLLADLDTPSRPAAPSSDLPESGKADAMLSNLLDGLDVPPSGPVDRPEGVTEGATEGDEHLDALLDSAIVTAAPAVASGLETLHQGQAWLAQEVEDLRKTSSETMTDILARLEALEEHCVGISEELAGLRERLAALEAELSTPAPAALGPEQMDEVVAHALSAMRQDIEKAAAASAAKVIREEISALFDAS